MKKKIAIFIACILMIALIAGITAGIIISKKKSAENTAKNVVSAVWWWDNRIDDSYLDFAKNNGVKEIFYYTSSFTQKTRDFIAKANASGIKVFWLTGKYEWIEDPAPLYSKIEEYIAFQNESAYKFEGIHFDIEPHQHPDFDSERTRLISSLISLASYLRDTYHDIKIEYDIPIWLHDEILFNGKSKPAYAHIIDLASRVTLMSYRDSAEEIYKSAKDEISYAVETGKTLVLGVETGGNDDDIVTFDEEGSSYMYEQLDILKSMIPSDYTIAVHHIKSWREMRR